MGIVPYDVNSLPATSYQPPLGPEQDEGGFWTAFGAEFQRSSPVLAAIGIATAGENLPDKEFDFETFARQDPLFARYPAPFYRARSAADWKQISTTIARDEVLLQKSESSGLGAFLGGAAGAVLSPDILIPGAAIYRGAKLANVLRMAAAVGGSAAAITAGQEVVLQADQELRSWEESALNVTFAAALGGLLGGAIGGLSKGQINRLGSDMATGMGREAIHIPGVTPSILDDARGTLSAAANPDPVDRLGLGRVKGIAPSLPGFEAALKQLNPVARQLGNEYSPTVRGVMGSLDTGGLHVSGTANVGGDVLSLSKQWLSLSFRALQERTRLMGGNFISRFLGAREFSEQTTFAMRRKGEHSDPAVREYAAYLREHVYNPLLAESRRVGMKGFDKLDDEYIEKYVNRMVRENLAIKDHDEFTAILAEHFTEKLTARWSQALERVEGANARDTQIADDLSLGREEVAELRASLEIEIKRLPEQFAEEIRVIAEDIRALRAEAKAATREDAKLLRAEADLLEKQNRELLAPFFKAERKIKGRFARLGRTASGLQTKQRAALQQIEALRDAADATRGRLVRQIDKIMRNLDRWTDEKLDLEMEKLEQQIEKTFAVWQRGDAKLAKMEEVPADFRELEYSDVRPTEAISIERARQLQREEKLDALLERLDAAKSMDRTAKREAVEAVAKDVAQEAEAVNFKRLKQEELLNERIRAADPSNAAREAEAIRAGIAQRTGRFSDQLVANNIGTKADNSVDVSAAARTLANYVAQQYIGNSQHMPFLSILKERGPELARMLDIDETRTWSMGRRFEEFLENDAEFLMRSYVRTMAADIELQRKFGTVNPMAPDSPYLRKIVDEFDAARTTAREAADRKIASGADPVKTEKALDTELERIAASQKNALIDLNAIVDRIRHTRGIPENPEAIGYRLGKFARNLAVVTMMGNMAITSVADLSAITIKHGFTAVFRDGFIPMVRNWQGSKLVMREVQDAGVALDLILHSRAAALFDVMDEVRGGWMAERGLQFASNHMGAITLMDRWNASIKQLEGVITITKISRNLETLANSAPGSKAAVKAERYLSGLGIDPDNARMMWREFSTSGDRIDGLTLPNTERWGTVSEDMAAEAERKLVPVREAYEDLQKKQKVAQRRLHSAEKKRAEAAPGAKAETLQKLDETLATVRADAKKLETEISTVGKKLSDLAAESRQTTMDFNQADNLRRVFRGAIARAVDNTIITPGGERPLWMDGSEMGRILGQFRSFTFASTQKILWAGAQNLKSGELAILPGLVFSVALGTLSYYIKRKFHSPEAAEEVDNASWEKLLIEGIKSSLVLGVLAEGQSFMEDIPGPVSGIATFGTGPEKRNPFSGPISGLFGPTKGTIDNLNNVISGMLSGEFKDGDVNSMRRLTPYNNVFWLSRAFHAVQEGVKQ